MKFLFLRGQVPQDRDPQEIVFKNIKDCDDVWTQLIYTMTGIKDSAELWYWNGKRKHRFSPNFVERWVPNFSTYQTKFVPDVIFCRGGFIEYHPILKRFPKSFKIYYGAGRRFLPQDSFTDYNLILQDSPQQLKRSQSKFPKSKSILFIKPAVDNLFYPIESKKIYDVVFPANGTQENIKGHEFVYRTAPRHVRILNLGNRGKLKPAKNVRRYRVLKSKMNKNLQKARVGIVCSSSNIDSCPRVIPEMLAAGIPIVCLDSVRFWKEKYITTKTGIISDQKHFWDNVDYVLNHLDQFNPRKHYLKHLALPHAAKLILNQIGKKWRI